MKKTIGLLLVLLFEAIIVPNSCSALSGTKTDDVTVKLYFKRSPEWKNYVKALTKNTDSKGVLEAKNVLEGWYKPVIDDSDTRDSQKLAAHLRMLNTKGQFIKNADVKMYVKNSSGDKIYAKTVKTDDKGWIESEGLVSGHEYYLEVNADKDEIRSFSKKENQPRIKAKAKKVGKNKKGENWIQGLYTRTDENQILDVGKIQEGYYEFFLKNGDVLPKGFFHIKANILDSNAKSLKKSATLKLFAFPQNKKTYAGEIKTADNGDVLLPKLIPNMKYQIIVMN